MKVTNRHSISTRISDSNRLSTTISMLASHDAGKVQYSGAEAFARVHSAKLLTKHLIEIAAPVGRLAYLALPATFELACSSSLIDLYLRGKLEYFHIYFPFRTSVALARAPPSMVYLLPPLGHLLHHRRPPLLSRQPLLNSQRLPISRSKSRCRIT
jgi:hypothetical protein